MFIINLFEQYYVRVNDKNWDEIFNPNYATLFKSKKEAKEWLVKNTTLEEYANVVDLKDTVEKYNEWSKNGSVRRSFDFVDNSLSRPYNNESPEEVLEWRLKVNSEQIRYDDYKTWPDLYTLFNNVYRLTEYHSDDYSKKYVSFELYFRKDSKFKEFKKEFDLILPKVTSQKNGYKDFSVFDHFLSEGGDSVDLFYKTDEDCYVAGRYTNKIKGSLKECFEYLRKERYYE